MKHILIGIISFNGPHRVHNCLESIAKWDDIPQNFRTDTLLVDDGSHDPHRESMIWLSKHWNIPIIIHKENMGISKSWNDICKFGNSDYIVLLNDDILVSKHWLTCMVYFLENNDNVGAAGWNFYFAIDSDVPQILESKEPLEIPREPITKVYRSDYKLSDKPGRIMAATGSCFAFSKGRYEEAGGFDEEYKSFYEETDFGTVLASLGYPSYMLPYPMLYHLWGKTFAENPEALKPTLRMNQSREYYKDKWGGDTDFTHPKYMDKITAVTVKWLDENLEVREDIIE